MTRHLPRVLVGLLVCANCSAADESQDAAMTGCSADCGSPSGTTGTDGVDGAVQDTVTDNQVLDVVIADPQYHIGTNVPGETGSEHFSVAVDGMTVPGVLGTQGAWMVVVAARTNQLPGVNRVDVEAKIAGLDDTVFGELRYKRRPLFPGGDDFSYLMNIFVVIGAPEDWAGQDAILTVSISPTGEDGPVLSDSVAVTLEQISEQSE